MACKCAHGGEAHQAAYVPHVLRQTNEFLAESTLLITESIPQGRARDLFLAQQAALCSLYQLVEGLWLKHYSGQGDVTNVALTYIKAAPRPSIPASMFTTHEFEISPYYGCTKDEIPTYDGPEVAPPAHGTRGKNGSKKPKFH
jgi:hypothetical protein